MGGAWSCCLPCAGGGGGGGGVAVSGTTPEAKKSSSLLKQYQQPHQQQKGQQHEGRQTQQKNTQQEQQQQQQPKRICVAQIKERAPLSDLDEDLDDDHDDDLDDEEKECELRIYEEEDYGRESGTQHRLSPRLHDIEEEDDEEGRHVRERSVANLVSRLFFFRSSLSAKRFGIEFIIVSSWSFFFIKDVYVVRYSARSIITTC